MRRSLASLLLACSLALSLSFAATPSHAQSFTGVGTSQIGAGTVSGDIQSVLLRIVNYVLLFVAFAAVVVIIYAGIRLIISVGNEEHMAEARKIILYAIVGLIIIILSRILVMFVVGFSKTYG